jgi:hypothetical protein
MTLPDPTVTLSFDRSTGTVLRSLQQVYGAKKDPRMHHYIDSPSFFESAGRYQSVDPVSRDMGCKGSSPTRGEGNSSIFLGNNQGPVVMVWDGMLPGEQESAKKNRSGQTRMNE